MRVLDTGEDQEADRLADGASLGLVEPLTPAEALTVGVAVELRVIDTLGDADPLTDPLIDPLALPLKLLTAVPLPDNDEDTLLDNDTLLDTLPDVLSDDDGLKLAS